MHHHYCEVFGKVVALKFPSRGGSVQEGAEVCCVSGCGATWVYRRARASAMPQESGPRTHF